MSYRLSKPGLRYEEEVRMGFFKKSQKIISVHGKIILNIRKSTVNLNWCEVSETFKSWHVFQMVPRINRKYSSEQFKVTALRNDDTLSLLRGREDNLQN